MGTGTLHLLAQHITASAVPFQREQTRAVLQGLERAGEKIPAL